MQEGKQMPIGLTEAEIKVAAAGKSEQLMEKRVKPVAITEDEIKLAAQGKSEAIFQRKTKARKE